MTVQICCSFKGCETTEIAHLYDDSLECVPPERWGVVRVDVKAGRIHTAMLCPDHAGHLLSELGAMP